MTDGMAAVVNGMQLQYSFDRDFFGEVEVTILGYEKVAGRDCIAYKIAYENFSITIYLDVDTKLCLKVVNDEGEGSFEFEVFKTSGFSFPD